MKKNAVFLTLFGLALVVGLVLWSRVDPAVQVAANWWGLGDLPVPGRFKVQPLPPNYPQYTAVQGLIERVDGPSYDWSPPNPVQAVAQEAVSTFSVDVDTASYSNVRRILRDGQPVPKAAVRIEEMLNYFHYDYPAPVRDLPLAITGEVADCPWAPEKRLLRIGLKAREMHPQQLPRCNLVFLIDVSGSMQSDDKLPLLKRGLATLVEHLNPHDRVAVVVYAGAAGLVLDSTEAERRGAILEAIEHLEAGGSTNGGEGIALAYHVARRNFVKDGVNRVILATDGDFNVGASNDEALIELIERMRESGVALSVLGFGRDNLNDSGLEKLADHGNGNYAYIDSLSEARRVLVEQAGGTLVTVVQDVKLQLEFDRERVRSYRLVGYSNRVLENQDFADDRKDAGEMGSGQSVTALYEFEPVSGPGRVARLKIRYKQPGGWESQLIDGVLTDYGVTLDEASEDFRFASAVAEFGMVLRHEGGSLDRVVQATMDCREPDRREFHEIVRRYAAWRNHS
ncbi:MAG: von Willebrand factor type A domain-containing protein [Vulcanimicrobiota bacterium]